MRLLVMNPEPVKESNTTKTERENESEKYFLDVKKNAH